MRRRRASEAEEGGGGGGGGGRPRASTGRMAGVSSIQQSGARGRTGSIQLLDSEISDSEDDDELAVLGEEEELPVEERLLKMNKMIRWDVLGEGGRQSDTDLILFRRSSTDDSRCDSSSDMTATSSSDLKRMQLGDKEEEEEDEQTSRGSPVIGKC